MAQVCNLCHNAQSGARGSIRRLCQLWITSLHNSPFKQDLCQEPGLGGNQSLPGFEGKLQLFESVI